MINRTYKDSLFRKLFGTEENKANALELYNALNGTGYSDPGALELTTIENVVYMGVKNDASFILGEEMCLWEHQSTPNPNMPLRGLVYFGRLYSKHIDSADLDVNSRRMQRIPAPRYIVFYSGAERRPERQVLRLSDMYGGGEGDVEVTATVLNVNKGCNERLMRSCRALSDYAEFVARVRANGGIMPIEGAIDEAVDSCIREGVMEGLLRSHRAEVKDMFLIDYDRERAERLMRRDAWEEGMEAGLAEGRAEGMRSAVLDSVASLMETMSLSFEQAADALRIPEGERGELEAALAANRYRGNEDAPEGEDGPAGRTVPAEASTPVAV